MRNNLVTILHCSECGNALELAHVTDKPAEQNVSSLKMSPSLPTGASMIANRISVKPCRVCIEKYTGPAKALAKALGQISAEVNK